MHLPLLSVFTGLSILLPTVLGDFHIVTSNCLDYEFSKRSLDTDADVAAALIEAREAAGGGGGDKPANWHFTGRSSTLNLLPSQNYDGRCDFLGNHEATNYESLPDSYFQVSGFCGENLDFYKTDHDTWEVWRNNANPGVKFGECYADPSTFKCDTWVGFYKNNCSWYRQYVCAMQVC
jgi:hypothetical protein